MLNVTNVDRFEMLMGEVKREGKEKLLDFIRNKTDFFTAPASTRYHSSFEGGLLEHSLNVCDCLLRKMEEETWKNILAPLGREKLIVIALLHDICKVNMYEVGWKNQKTYKPDGTKKDEKGYFDWESVPTYTINDKIPYGHGEKSVMIIEEFMKLEKEERYAIRWHMAFSEPKENYNTLSAAIEKYPVILAVSEADLEATYLLEARHD